MRVTLVLLGFALVCVVPLALPSEAAAQAWTRDQGSAYLNLNARFISADEFFGPDGEKFPIRSTYTQVALGFYGEVGLVDRWLTLTLDGELFRRSALEDQGAVEGLGDLRAGLWTGVLQAPFHLALGVVAGLPTGDPSPSAGPGADAGAQTIAAVLPTGDGEFDVSFRAAGGHGFAPEGWPLQHYVLGELGYAVRTEGFSDQILGRAEFGSRIDEPGWDRGLLILRLATVQSLDSGQPSFSGLGDGVSYVSWGAELHVRLWRTLSLAGGFDGAFSGENVPAAPSFKVALSYEIVPERDTPE